MQAPCVGTSLEAVGSNGVLLAIAPTFLVFPAEHIALVGNATLIALSAAVLGMYYFLDSHEFYDQSIANRLHYMSDSWPSALCAIRVDVLSKGCDRMGFRSA